MLVTRNENDFKMTKIFSVEHGGQIITYWYEYWNYKSNFVQYFGFPQQKFILPFDSLTQQINNNIQVYNFIKGPYKAISFFNIFGHRLGFELVNDLVFM